MIKKLSCLFILSIGMAEGAFKDLGWPDRMIDLYAGKADHPRRPIIKSRLAALTKDDQHFVNEMAAYLIDTPNKHHIWVLSYLALTPPKARVPFKNLISSLFNPARITETAPPAVRRVLMTRVLHKLCYVIPPEETAYKKFCTSLKKKIQQTPNALTSIKSLQTTFFSLPLNT